MILTCHLDRVFLSLNELLSTHSGPWSGPEQAILPGMTPYQLFLHDFSSLSDGQPSRTCLTGKPSSFSTYFNTQLTAHLSLLIYYNDTIENNKSDRGYRHSLPG